MASERSSAGPSTGFDVAVVGLGPVGAVLAGLLGKRGLRVVVFDRETGLYPLPRAAHVDHTGLRTLQELGCLEELLPQMLPNPGTDCVSADRQLLFSLPGDVPTPSGLPASMYFYQPVFDGTLRRTIAALPGVEVRLSTEVTGLEQSPGGVRVATRGPDGVAMVDAAWVVGCDGASSRVRQLAGIERTSFGFEEQWVIFDLRLREPRPPLPTRAVQVCDPARPHTELPMPGDRYRFEFMLMPGERAEEMLRADVAFERLMAALVPRRAVEIERTATYTFAGLVADSWRAGRVFLAGDAAHLMPPFLGQGMCSGIRDAANLAWKLDLVHRRGAADALLDTYTTERRPHVSSVIGSAVELGRIICTIDAEEAAERDRSMLERHSTEPPYRFTLPSLARGPLVLEGGGDLCLQPAGPAGARLDDAVGQRFLVVVEPGAEDEPAARWWRRAMGAQVASPADLPDPDGRLSGWLRRRHASRMVVRPDRYLMWAGEDLDAATAAVRSLLTGGRDVPATTLARSSG